MKNTAGGGEGENEQSNEDNSEEQESRTGNNDHPTTGNHDQNKESERKTYPGVVFWIASRVLNCETQKLENKYMHLFSTAGFSIYDCKV